jgi:putative ubiquitin-RnfH superfamily antitoxin RatB of RatAB toxin-antitoxin module
MSSVSDAGVLAIMIEVVYALPERQSLVEVTVPQGTTVSQAIDLSGLREEFPAMEVSEVGIFSRKVSLDHELREGDRVEIYRPLIASPNEMRRKRALGETSTD